MARDLILYYTKVRKAGNSLAIIIPPSVMNHCKFKVGDEMALVLDSVAPTDLYFVRIFFKKLDTVSYEETLLTTVTLRQIGKSVGINAPQEIKSMLHLRKGSYLVFVVDMILKKKGAPIRFYFRRLAEDED